MARRFNRTTGCPVGPSCRGLLVLIGRLLTLRAGAPDRDAFLMAPDARDQQGRLEELVHDVVRLADAVVHERGIPVRVLVRKAGAPMTRIALGHWVYPLVPVSKAANG